MSCVEEIGIYSLSHDLHKWQLAEEMMKIHKVTGGTFGRKEEKNTKAQSKELHI